VGVVVFDFVVFVLFGVGFLRDAGFFTLACVPAAPEAFVTVFVLLFFAALILVVVVVVVVVVAVVVGVVGGGAFAVVGCDAAVVEGLLVILFVFFVCLLFTSDVCSHFLFRREIMSDE
jgi:hypothetical protein